MNKLALEAAEKYRSEETGYIHFSQTIPFYENLCYALALFNTKTKEEVEKGIIILHKLLFFQNGQGFFPTFLHEYPEAKDPLHGVYYLKPLKRILTQFKLIIPYRDKLEHQCKLLEEGILRYFDEKKPSGFIAYLLHKSESIEPSKYYLSIHLAELFKDKRGFDDIRLFWHPQSESFVGPSFKEKQEGYEPEITLLDLFLGTKRKNLNMHHLQACFVEEVLSLPPFIPFTEEKNQDGFRWAVRQKEEYAFSVLDKKNHETLFYQPGCQLFRLVMPGIHTIVLEAGDVEKSRFELTENGVNLYLTLNKNVNFDDREKIREVTFYYDRRLPIPEHKTGGNLFHIGETLQLGKISLHFSIYQGTGDFSGHILLENRPSQLIKTEVFDRAITLRTLRRSDSLILKISIVCE